MYRFPDTPNRIGPDALEGLRPGEWYAQLKFDGWRTIVRWYAGAVTLTSRHNEPIPATPAMVAAIAEFCRGTGLTSFVLDGEWMGRRDSQPESLWLFDLLELGGEWLGNHTCADRWGSLQNLIGFAPGLRATGERLGIRVVPCVTEGYAELFEASKVPGCEGIVLKHRESRYIGSVRKSVDNPQWLKVKWREGADGQTRVVA